MVSSIPFKTNNLNKITPSSNYSYLTVLFIYTVYGFEYSYPILIILFNHNDD